MVELFRKLGGYATNPERALVVMSQLAYFTGNMFDNKDLDLSLTRLNKPLSLNYSGKQPSELINLELIKMVYCLEEKQQIFHFYDTHPFKINREYIGLTPTGMETVKELVKKKPFSNFHIQDLVTKVTKEVVLLNGDRHYFGKQRDFELSEYVSF
jgi:hypothetical protein